MVRVTKVFHFLLIKPEASGDWEFLSHNSDEVMMISLFQWLQHTHSSLFQSLINFNLDYDWVPLLEMQFFPFRVLMRRCWYVCQKCYADGIWHTFRKIITIKWSIGDKNRRNDEANAVNHGWTKTRREKICELFAQQNRLICDVFALLSNLINLPELTIYISIFGLSNQQHDLHADTYKISIFPPRGLWFNFQIHSHLARFHQRRKTRV